VILFGDPHASLYQVDIVPRVFDPFAVVATGAP
jgi:hypothetical protein